MIRFEWDPGKAQNNLRKQDVLFEDALLVFEDPMPFSSRIGSTKQENCAGGSWVVREEQPFCWWPTITGKTAEAK